jgi:hypothetical protein
MELLRQEIRNYVRACEELLSTHLEPRLTEEEQDLVIYYVNELFAKFGYKPITVHQSFRARTDPVILMQRGQGILNAVVMGEFELAAAEIEFVEILNEAVRSGATKVLINGQQMTGNPGDFERFLYGEFAAWATLEVMRERNVALRFAYVIHKPLCDPTRFDENVAVNRGMEVKTFEDTNAAIQWLNAA